MEYDGAIYHIIHYHLILQTGDSPLSKVMHLINSSYSRNYNRKRGRTGHVFEGRYKAIPVQNERYLLTVLRYDRKKDLLPQLNTIVKQ